MINRYRRTYDVEFQYPADYFDAYGTRAFRGDYVPYKSDGKADKLSYYTHVPEQGSFSRFSDGFNPYSRERYARELSFDQSRVNTGLGEYAKYKTLQDAIPAAPEVKPDWALIWSVIICIIVLGVSTWFTVDRYLDGNPELGKSGVEVTQTVNKTVK